MNELRKLLIETKTPHRENGTHSHAREGWIQVNCPYCMDMNFKLGLSLHAWAANCYKCGRKNRFNVLLEVTKLAPKELVNRIGKASIIKKQTIEKSGSLKEPEGLEKLSKAFKDYIKKERGLKPKQIVEMWDVRAIRKHELLSWRLYIPIKIHGRTVSWTTRHIGEHPLRYLSAKKEHEDIHHKDILYGLDYARQESAIVHEGPIDVWSTGPGSVGTFGTGWTRKQLEILKEFHHLYICFDTSKTAQKRARSLAKEIGPSRCTIIELETGEDANACSKKELEELRELIL